MTQGNVRSYLLNPIFDIVKKLTISKNWSTPSELRTFFIKVPHYDLDALLDLEYSNFADYLGKPKKKDPTDGK